MLLDLFKSLAKEIGADELAAMGAGLEEEKDEKENLTDGEKERQ